MLGVNNYPVGHHIGGYMSSRICPNPPHVLHPKRALMGAAGSGR